MHLLVPRSRSSSKVKVKYKGYFSQKMAVSVAFVFHKNIFFFGGGVEVVKGGRVNSATQNSFPSADPFPTVYLGNNKNQSTESTEILMSLKSVAWVKKSGQFCLLTVFHFYPSSH